MPLPPQLCCQLARGGAPQGVCVCARGLHASVNFKPSFSTSKLTGLCVHLPPPLSRAEAVCFSTAYLLLTPNSICRTNTRAHAHTTHLPRLTQRTPPPQRKTCCVSNCKSDYLALEDVNSRLISPLPTWVRSPTRPPPLSPAVRVVWRLTTDTNALYGSHTHLSQVTLPC